MTATPSGVPGTSDQKDLFPVMCATTGICIIAASISIVAHLVAKKTASRINIEDYCLVAAWIFMVGYGVIFIIQGTNGVGRHVWEVDNEALPRIRKLSWVVALDYCLGAWFAKAALLLQLQRIFTPKVKGIIYFACQILIWLNLAIYFSAFVALVFECTPQRMIWDKSEHSGHCINTGGLLVATSIINIISDVTILVLPSWAVLHLRVNLKKRLGISAIFATGALAVACSICRLIYTYPPFSDKDDTYLFAPLGMWSLGEMTSIILVTCFPSVPRIIQLITGKARRQSTGQSTQAALSSTIGRTPLFHRMCRDCRHGLPCLLHTRAGEPLTTDDEKIDPDLGCVSDADRTAVSAQHFQHDLSPTSSCLSSEGSTLQGSQDSSSSEPSLAEPEKCITVRRDFRVQRNVAPEELNQHEWRHSIASSQGTSGYDWDVHAK